MKTKKEIADKTLNTNFELSIFIVIETEKYIKKKWLGDEEWIRYRYIFLHGCFVWLVL